MHIYTCAHVIGSVCCNCVVMILYCCVHVHVYVGVPSHMQVVQSAGHCAAQV